MSGYGMIPYIDDVPISTNRGDTRCKECIYTLHEYDEGEGLVDTGPYPWVVDQSEDRGEWELDEDTLGYWDETFEEEDSPLIWPDDEDDTSPILEEDDEPLGAD